VLLLHELRPSVGRRTGQVPFQTIGRGRECPARLGEVTAFAAEFLAVHRVGDNSFNRRSQLWSR
jgi:hypothetical protein